MKSSLKFVIECDGARGERLEVIFFKLNNGNVGTEIRMNGNLLACSPEGEKPEDIFNMANALKYS